MEFTPPSVSSGTGEAQKRSTKRPGAAEKQPGQSPADPTEAGNTQKRKTNPIRTAQDRPEAREGPEPPISLPKQ
ncbi:MAG: hypothetical protein MJA30_04155 [Cytophagales bacterium]|nr:hypothetical protein [Cytophagales bacterium]